MMQLYTFHPLADAKQDEIWYYTYQQWGMQQAGAHLPERIQVPAIKGNQAQIIGEFAC